MPTIITRGAASAQALGYASSSAAVTYIEDVFSTYLYSGNSSTQTITNGIDLSGKGGLVWIKQRTATFNHSLFDTSRGAGYVIQSNTVSPSTLNAITLTGFTSSGFSLLNSAAVNASSSDYVSWTFREQPKFFDIVTYTGDGAGSQPVAHNLGSAPGFILCKATSTSDNWAVYHRGNGTTEYTTLSLNLTTAAGFAGSLGTVNAATFNAAFVLDATGVQANASGVTYVAYLFAHNAGGFGLTGTDNVISCGSFTDTASTPGTFVELGWEPQLVLYKRATGGISDWYIMDNMRGFSTTTNGTTGSASMLSPNTNLAENSNAGGFGFPTSTGFYTGSWYGGSQWIYIAIRRGPMKVPTDATTVFSPIASSASGGVQLTTNFPVDLQMYGIRAGDAANITTNDRLRGVSTTSTAGGNFIVTSSTAAETGGSYTRQWGNTGFVMPAGIGDTSGIFWNFRRAPGFFDEVCYTGTLYSAGTYPKTHNLGVTPELIILKKRDASSVWYTWTTGFATTAVSNEYLSLNTTSGKSNSNDNSIWGSSPPTASVFNVGQLNNNLNPYVAYLFATVAGVSKVGSYTGNGTTQTIDCGFGAGGVRFVLIKRTDSTGGWYVYDTARGMTVLTDPYLLLNTTAAEVATLGSVTTVSTGFALNSTILADINVSAGTYIFFAVS